MILGFEISRFCSGGQWGELHLTTQVVDASDQALDHLAAVAASEVAGAEIFVFNAVFEHVVGGGKHGGRDGQNGFLGAAPSAQAMELSLQIGVLNTHRSPGSR